MVVARAVSAREGLDKRKDVAPLRVTAARQQLRSHFCQLGQLEINGKMQLVRVG